MHVFYVKENKRKWNETSKVLQSLGIKIVQLTVAFPTVAVGNSTIRVE